jgi:hypothetical protein
MTDEEDWIYTLDGKPWGIAEVNDKSLSLRDDQGGGRTQRFIRPTVVPGGRTGETTVEVAIHHRRSASKPFAPLNLATLRDAEWVRIELNSDETLALHRHLKNLYVIGGQGAGVGARAVRVASAEEVTVSGPLAGVIGRLRAQYDDDELSGILGELMPDLVEAAALKLQLAERLDAIDTLEQHINAEDWNEPAWKKWFAANPWIFGHGLAYEFLVDEAPEAHVGGHGIFGGAQMADHVMGTPGAWRFAVVVEIKKPDTPLLGSRYRNGAYRIGAELAGGVAQAQANCQALIAQAETRAGSEDLAALSTSVADPQAILVIGTLGQLTNEGQRRTFHRFRRNLWNPTVLTFDELLGRARYLVEHPGDSATASANPPSDLDLDVDLDEPF